mmetsp:Transcript_8899/g.15127  ORF Transcript_8899/g.15127 Transcript_8899/m.15127 type:complete len:1145 (-) Transcript_8899:3-3437(-)
MSTEEISSTSSTSDPINDEILEAKKLYPSINVLSTSPSSISVSYNRGYNCVYITLTIPNEYPKHPLVVSIDKDTVVPSGLKKQLEKKLNEVAIEKSQQSSNSAYQQVAAVWGCLVSFLDTNLAFPIDFPCGSNSVKCQNHVRKALGKDARASIQSFQQSNSLHSYFAKAFGTVPVHEASQQKEKQQQASSANKHVEPLDPSPALEFLSHLGVSRHEVHSRVATALRAAIEDEIQRMPLPSTNSSNNGQHSRGSADEDHGHPLLRLLKSAWPFREVTELRPVLICLLKRLGDNTPVEMLRKLGAKKGDGLKELKHADLISQLGPHMQRLVWEADWDHQASTTDGNNRSEEEITLRGSTILADFIQPAVDQYVNDGALVQAAELAFVGGISERRLATKSRRMEAKDSDVTGGADETTSGTLASIGVGGKTSSKGGKDEPKTTTPSSAQSITSIKETVGRRPKLLGAVLDMLISEYATSGGGLGNIHSMTVAEKKKKLLMDGGSILGGATNLTCTLVSDILLSFGQLPRSYEALGILARLLDAAVQVGSISDNTLAQIQGCLRTLFRPTDSDLSQKPPVTPTKMTQDTSQSGKKIKLSLKNIPTKIFPDHPIDDSEFARKLLQKVLKKAIALMKENDPQGLFLNPVTDAIAPGYSSIIKRPMCIRTIEEQMMESSYDSIEDFRDDTLLMFANCVKYNVGDAGQWFRVEAQRQKQLWKEKIYPEAKSKLSTEKSKRKAALKKAKANESTAAGSKKRKPPPPLAFAPGMKKSAVPTSEKKKDDAAINNLTAKDVDPLPPWRYKRRKKEVEIPSLQCLASMLLADPFVIRLLVDKIEKIVRADIMKNKSVPSGNALLPSLLQLLNIAKISTQLCAMKGKRLAIPDAGLKEILMEGEDRSLPYETLRNFLPLFSKLLLDVDLDKRIALGGDLYDAAAQSLLAPSDVMDAEWNGASSLQDLRVIVEGAFIHLMQPGNTNEVALQNQFPRFVNALDKLSDGNMIHEKPFFISLSHALLRYKTKLPHSTRDLVTNVMIKWLRLSKDSNESCLCSALHECFMRLLNEWASLGNAVLSRDLFLSLSEQAIAAADKQGDEQQSALFVSLWIKNDAQFALVKEQYLRMLTSTPEKTAGSWKEKLGIPDEKADAMDTSS